MFIANHSIGIVIAVAIHSVAMMRTIAIIGQTSMKITIGINMIIAIAAIIVTIITSMIINIVQRMVFVIISLMLHVFPKK